MPNSVTKDDSYTAKHIQVQEGLEAVRKRPGMYIGSIDEDGLHHLVYEIVDNSIDEAQAGHCDKISITIHKDNSISIEDNGRGIPVDMHNEGKSALEVVMTKLHAGGKFSKDAYEISGGLHGVGCAVVNALSSHCEVVVHRKGKKHTQKYEKGHAVTEIITEHSDDLPKTGTLVRFAFDRDIFKESQKFDFSRLAHRFRELAFLIKNISISICDERENPPKKETFFSENGIVDFLRILSKDKKMLLEKPPVFKSTSDDSLLVEFAFNYTLGQETTILSFVNSINTREGGTHLSGFSSAFTRTLNAHLKKHKNLSKRLEENRSNKEALTGVDVQTGLLAVMSLKVKDPIFSGQTKTRISNQELRGDMARFLSVMLSEFMDHNPNNAQKILEKCVQSARARIDSEKAYNKAIRKTPLGSASLPGKLCDCSEKDPSKSEIFLVEGDSAGGSAKQGRDSMTQAILSMFGKPTNVEKTNESTAKILESPKLQPIIASLGTSIGTLFNLEKLRYHKVIIMADADVDGSHIKTLLLTFFFRYMRPLIEQGYIYIAMPPLYLLSWGTGKNKSVYLYDDDELEKQMEILKKNNIEKYTMRRYKGLGEMNDEELWSTTMNPQTRKIIKISLENAVEADETFTLLLGEKVEPRRAFIEENALKVEVLDT